MQFAALVIVLLSFFFNSVHILQFRMIKVIIIVTVAVHLYRSLMQLNGKSKNINFKALQTVQKIKVN